LLVSLNFFEEVEETPYAIARMLLTLKHAGKFDDVAGIVVGPVPIATSPRKHRPIR
jgi:muramoyltetrapeptide carboxypeptidase